MRIMPCASRAVPSLTFWLCLFLPQASLGQVSVLTHHNDNSRTGLNPNETVLTPSNVNPRQFGKLFAYNVDGYIPGQPLYVSNVNIGGGIHNVVYVATLHDSVYAFDADQNLGAPLWQVSFINPDAGITTVPMADTGCTEPALILTEVGAMSTPVIDPLTGTLYVVAKTKENGAYFYRLHALDITTGQEKFGGPVAITASANGPNGAVSLNQLRQLSRPGLLLSNGVVYMAFGSNGCDAGGHGWVLGYNATSLQQVGAFVTAPTSLASVWQTAGITGDNSGNVYVATGNGAFDGSLGGSNYGDSILKLSPLSTGLTLSDYFTPYNQAYLDGNDLDLGSGGVLLLPDQPGPYPHLLLGAGKQGTIYVLNRDNMGQFNFGSDSQIVQSLVGATGPVTGVPAYWNNIVYYASISRSVRAYSLSNGMLSSNPVSQSSFAITLPGIPSISANGTSGGVLWVPDYRFGQLYAFDATNLSSMLYFSGQASIAARDAPGTLYHFIGPTIANGKLYLGTVQQLVVYGLLPSLTITGGNNQTGAVVTSLPTPLQVQITDPYSGNVLPRAGVTITFSDGGLGGSFSNVTVVTDNTGSASTTYTLPKKAGLVSVTASSLGYAWAPFTEVASPGSPAALVRVSGSAQTAPVVSPVPAPFGVQVNDAYGNAVPGATVSFSDGGAGGSFSATAVVTNSFGRASASYTTSTVAGVVHIAASVSGATPATWGLTVTAGPPASLSVVSGNNQSIAAGSTLLQPLRVKVQDSYGNGVPGKVVNFSDNGAGGSFSPASPTSGSTGIAATSYTAPLNAGTVNVTASLAGIPSVSFTVIVRIPVSASVAFGNNQTAPAGSILATALGVIVTDSGGNRVPGVLVSFSDGGAGGIFSVNPATSLTTGVASSRYTAPTKAGKVTVTGSVAGLAPVAFTITVNSGPAASLSVVSGNNQVAPAGSTLPQALVVGVADRYGNPVSGTTVSFSDGGAGGSFSAISVTSNSSGQASATYTLPNTPGTVTVTASAAGVGSVSFSLTAN